MAHTVDALIAKLQAIPEELRSKLVVGFYGDDEGNTTEEWDGFLVYAKYDEEGDYRDKFSSWAYDLDEDGDVDESTERRVSQDEATAILL